MLAFAARLMDFTRFFLADHPKSRAREGHLAEPVDGGGNYGAIQKI
jgi:hypothetical protein